MVELRVVRFIGGPPSQHHERFAAVKARTLPYVDVKLLRKDMPGEGNAVPADIGAVRTAADAKLLLEALRVEFPDQTFVVEEKRYGWAGGAVWYPSDR